MRRIPNACLVALVAGAAALAGPVGPASAAGGWHFGPLVETSISDCYTSDIVNGVGEYAGAQYDDASPPKTGDVFYVNVVVNGIDASCVESTLPEILLPAGVATAITAQNPIKCFTVDNSTATETPDAADCQQALGAPLVGGTGSIRDVNGPAPGLWDTRAPNAWEFQIPLTASTAGLAQISFPTQVISGSAISTPSTLEPTVSVPVVAGAAPPSCCTPPGPAKKKFAILARGSTAKVTADGRLIISVVPQEAGTGTAVGTITMSKRGKVVRLGKAKLHFRAAATTKVSLKLSKASARIVRAALAHHERVNARITLTAVSATGDTAAARLTFKVKR